MLNLNGLLADLRWASRNEGHRILRPEVYQLLRVLRQCGLNVPFVRFLDGR